MNFLAHALLAGESTTLRVGGLAGDFVKGPLPAGLPDDLADGVALHRAIDSFAEVHPAFRASRARIGSERRRYAGVIVDMFYDHLLAVHWPAYAPIDLESFAAGAYAATQARLEELPVSFREVFERMRGDNWLVAYRQRESVALALDRMSRHRIRRRNPLAGAIAEFDAAAAGFALDFSRFLPDAADFARRWIATRERP